MYFSLIISSPVPISITIYEKLDTEQHFTIVIVPLNIYKLSFPWNWYKNHCEAMFGLIFSLSSFVWQTASHLTYLGLPPVYLPPKPAQLWLPPPPNSSTKGRQSQGGLKQLSIERKLRAQAPSSNGRRHERGVERANPRFGGDLAAIATKGGAWARRDSW